MDQDKKRLLHAFCSLIASLVCFCGINKIALPAFFDLQYATTKQAEEQDWLSRQSQMKFECGVLDVMFVLLNSVGFIAFGDALNDFLAAAGLMSTGTSRNAVNVVSAAAIFVACNMHTIWMADVLTDLSVFSNGFHNAHFPFGITIAIRLVRFGILCGQVYLVRYYSDRSWAVKLFLTLLAHSWIGFEVRYLFNLAYDVISATTSSPNAGVERRRLSTPCNRPAPTRTSLLREEAHRVPESTSHRSTPSHPHPNHHMPN